MKTAENAFLLCLDGKSGGAFESIPEEYASLPVMDHSGKLIIPGLTDLHVHAPQFAFRSLGMDMELLEWLNKKTFPEEAKYGDLEYAREAYSRFIADVKKGPNTRLCVYATIHTPATLLLMDMLEESGLVSLAGKVSMDRNCPDYLKECDASGSSYAAGAAEDWLKGYFKRQKEGRESKGAPAYKNIFPILTPRFIPSCSDELLKSLAEMQKSYPALPVQSHLSENRREVEWVRELCPESETYTEAYAKTGLMQGPCVMAHCVWLDENEMELLAEKGVYAAHCPQSNTNLSSGIAPVRRLMEKGVPLGLGSDVAGGAHTSIFRAISDAIQVSKLRRVYALDEKALTEKALTIEEAFYLGTAGGGSFFGKLNINGLGSAGSFEPGWDFDALIIDDGAFLSGFPGGESAAKRHEIVSCNIRERLEQVVYLSDDRQIIAKYVRGIEILRTCP
jgi:guanine deaminase